MCTHSDSFLKQSCLVSTTLLQLSSVTIILLQTIVLFTGTYSITVNAKKHSRLIKKLKSGLNKLRQMIKHKQQNNFRKLENATHQIVHLDCKN